MSSCPNSTEDWSIVCRRRRRRPGGNKHRNNGAAPFTTTSLTLSTDPPSPWSPSDPNTDPDRESRILKRIHASIDRLDTSPFYRRFVSRLRDPHIHDVFARLGDPIHIVVYGIGSIESAPNSRLQLALVILLVRDLVRNVTSMEVFDPVLSAAECAVLETLGFVVIRQDERGRREAAAPTFFYMPHCDAELYENLLDANWRPVALNRMVVLGNSFSKYHSLVEMMNGEYASGKVGSNIRHVLGVRKYVREVGMDEVGMDGVKMVRSKGKERDNDDELFEAFQDTSWHFFEVDDDADMELNLKNAIDVSMVNCSSSL